MSGSTITTTTTLAVTLGSGSYSSPLTITSAGDVAPSAYGADGVYGSVSSGLLTLINDGTITGSTFNGYTGSGVELTGALLINGGTITGGTGGRYTGPGGTGVGLTSGTLTNSGTITGGAAYSGSGGSGSRGGDGVDLSYGALTNSGIISGGTGGAAYGAGDGGVGVNLSSGIMTNNAAITGGSGGYGIADSIGNGGNGGGGGIGVVLASSTATNNGAITGGAGAVGGGGGNGGAGASGVEMLGASYIAGVFGGGFVYASALTNSGTITGGAGSAGEQGASGGNGVYVAFGQPQSPGKLQSLTNDGTITGGSGGYCIGVVYYRTGGFGGAGVNLVRYTALTNYGAIIGGAGGAVGTGVGGGGGSPQEPLVGGFGGYGVVLSGGSTVTNDGTISGGVGANAHRNGSYVYGGNGGVGVYDVSLGDPSTLTNSGSSAIIGGGGGYGYGRGGQGGPGAVLSSYVYGPSTVTNDGTITGGNGGGSYHYGGAGGQGVALGSGLLINSGTITGGKGGSAGTSGTAGVAGDAVQFGTGVGTLIVDPGAVFNGYVVANSSVADVLEFGVGATAGTVGTLTGVGTQFVGFNDFSFASGASWDVSGTYTAFDPGQTITGFAVGDTLVLDGFAANKDSYVSGVGLELGHGGSTITLDITGNFTTSEFSVTSSPTTTTIWLNSNPCFAAGTRILLRHGEVPVEKLAEGDEVILASGGTAPIRWLGHRRLSLSRHPKPETVLPVLIEADAIMDGVPRRDLYVSPDHALFLGGCLIPAKALINGTTIRQVERRSVTYYHVELPEHAVLYADGVPAESYLETGNRGAFANGGKPVILHPDFAQTLREEKGCAPFAEAGPVVEVVRARILARAGIETTADARLTIRPCKDGSAVIESRSAIPGHLTPDPRDCRRLGVKIATLSIGGEDIALDHPALTEGWHDVEPDGRWTDGRAVIPGELLRGRKPAVTLAATLNYPVVERKARRSTSRIA